MARKRATKRKADGGKEEEEREMANDAEISASASSSPVKESPDTVSEESRNGQISLDDVLDERQNGAMESDASANVSEDSDVAETLNGGTVNGTRMETLEEHAEDEDEDEEDILVVLELADFKNHPILDDYKSITIEGLDTAKPTLHIGEYSLHGQLEETVGTHFFYDTKNRTEKNEYRFTGQTTKKIKFTIAPPDEYH